MDHNRKTPSETQEGVTREVVDDFRARGAESLNRPPRRKYEGVGNLWSRLCILQGVAVLFLFAAFIYSITHQ